jgi:hypothetical protein
VQASASARDVIMSGVMSKRPAPGCAALATNEGMGTMTLEEVEKGLRDLQPDGSFLLTDAQLAQIDIPGKATLDTKAKADWLKDKFQCVCEVSTTTGHCVFRRSSKSN